MNLILTLLSVVTVVSMAQAKVPYVVLSTGAHMPVIGLGTAQANGTVLVQAIKDAIDIGYRHLDTAAIYYNEKDVGQAIQEMIAAGVVKREDVFVTTKVCRHGQAKRLQEGQGGHNSFWPIFLGGGGSESIFMSQ